VRAALGTGSEDPSFNHVLEFRVDLNFGHADHLLKRTKRAHDSDRPSLGRKKPSLTRSIAALDEPGVSIHEFLDILQEKFDQESHRSIDLITLQHDGDISRSGERFARFCRTYEPGMDFVGFNLCFGILHETRQTERMTAPRHADSSLLRVVDEGIVADGTGSLCRRDVFLDRVRGRARQLEHRVECV